MLGCMLGCLPCYIECLKQTVGALVHLQGRDMVWGAAGEGRGELMMLSHTSGKSLPYVSVEAWNQGSFTPLSNHLDSAVSIYVPSNPMECGGWLTWMCFTTSEVVELGRWSSSLPLWIFLSHHHTLHHALHWIWSYALVPPRSFYIVI